MQVARLLYRLLYTCVKAAVHMCLGQRAAAVRLALPPLVCWLVNNTHATLPAAAWLSPAGVACFTGQRWYQWSPRLEGAFRTPPHHRRAHSIGSAGRVAACFARRCSWWPAAGRQHAQDYSARCRHQWRWCWCWFHPWAWLTPMGRRPLTGWLS